MQNEASPSPTQAAPSILARTATSTGWIVGWRMATRIIGLISTLTLVRLLVPADFGLVALAVSFVAAVDTFSAFGVEDAVVREHAPSPAMYDTAFTISVIRSVLTAVLVAAGATSVADFFGDHRLAYVMWALAAGMIINGFASVGIIDFRRDMVFEKEFQLQIVPRLLGTIVTIGAAFAWHSFWALVAGILMSRVFRTLYSYWMHPWRPRFTLSAWQALIGFSLWSWAIGMATLVRDRTDMFVLGRVLNTTSVGVYAIGEEVAALPTTEIVLPLCRASFSAFAEAKRTGAAISEAFLRPVSTTFLLTFPAGLGVSLIADPLIRLIMGEKWVEAVPVLELLGVVGGVSIFGWVAAALLSAFTMLREQFLIMVLATFLRLILLLLFVYEFGLLGAALGASCGVLLEHGMLMLLVFRRFDLRPGAVLRGTWRTLLAGGAMAGAMWGTGFGWRHLPSGEATWFAMIGAMVFGAAVYATALLALWLASGRPRGPESDMLALGAQVLRGLATRLMRLRRPA